MKHGRRGNPTLHHLRRRGRAVVPFVVWLAALIAAIHLYRQGSHVGEFVGFATDETVTIRSIEPAVVRDVYVGLHDTVAAEQVLIGLDDQEERIRISAIELDVQRLAAEVAAEQERLDTREAISSRDTEDLLRRFLVDREAAHIAYLDVLANDARNRMLLRGASVEYDIIRNLVDRGATNERELNDARKEFDSIQAFVHGNVAVVAQAEATFQEADRRWAQFAKRSKEVTAYDPVLMPLRLAVDVRMKDLDELIRQLDAHVIRAPISGTVTAMLAHPGEPYLAGDTLLTISPNSSHRIIALLPEANIHGLSVGARVSVRCQATLPDELQSYDGVVESLSSIVSQASARFRIMPNIPVWGRTVIVALPATAHVMPGEPVQINVIRKERNGIWPFNFVLN